MALLARRNLFDAEFAEAMLDVLVNGDDESVRVAAAGMGEALAHQAEALAAGLERRGARADAGKLRAQARLAHAEWERAQK